MLRARIRFSPLVCGCGRLSRHVPGFTKLKSASTKLERKDVRARSSTCAGEGGEVQKNEECRKIKTARDSDFRAVFIIRINNLDYCTLLAE